MHCDLLIMCDFVRSFEAALRDRSVTSWIPGPLPRSIAVLHGCTNLHMIQFCMCRQIVFFMGWVTPNDLNSKTKIQNGKDLAEQFEMSKSTTGKNILEMKHPSPQKIKHINKHTQQRTNPLHQLLACFASLRSRPPLAKDSAPACSSCAIHIRFYRNAKA